MDKYEYRIKLDEMNKLVEEQNYKGALKIAETIDWRRVRNIRTLCMVAEIFEVNEKYQESKQILQIAYERAQVGRSVLYRMTELAVKMKEFDEAVDYYTEFVQASPSDNSKYILKYKIYKGRGSSIEDQIKILEDYKDKEHTEKWSYELAKLYHKAGLEDKCLEECEDLILWFNEGKYVYKAMELKMNYMPLTPEQRRVYDKRHEVKDEVVIEESLKKEMEAAAKAREKEEKLLKAIEKRAKRAEQIKEVAPKIATPNTSDEFLAEQLIEEAEKEIALSVTEETKRENHKVISEPQTPQTIKIPIEKVKDKRAGQDLSQTSPIEDPKVIEELTKGIAANVTEAVLSKNAPLNQTYTDFDPAELQEKLAKSMHEILSGISRKTSAEDEELDRRKESVQVETAKDTDTSAKDADKKTVSETTEAKTEEDKPIESASSVKAVNPVDETHIAKAEKIAEQSQPENAKAGSEKGETRSEAPKVIGVPKVSEAPSVSNVFVKEKSTDVKEKDADVSKNEIEKSAEDKSSAPFMAIEIETVSEVEDEIVDNKQASAKADAALSEEEMVEKQITGQLSIEDIMEGLEAFLDTPEDKDEDTESNVQKSLDSSGRITDEEDDDPDFLVDQELAAFTLEAEYKKAENKAAEEESGAVASQLKNQKKQTNQAKQIDSPEILQEKIDASQQESKELKDNIDAARKEAANLDSDIPVSQEQKEVLQGDNDQGINSAQGQAGNSSQNDSTADTPMIDLSAALESQLLKSINTDEQVAAAQSDSADVSATKVQQSEQTVKPLEKTAEKIIEQSAETAAEQTASVTKTVAEPVTQAKSGISIDDVKEPEMTAEEDTIDSQKMQYEKPEVDIRAREKRESSNSPEPATHGSKEAEGTEKTDVNRNISEEESLAVGSVEPPMEDELEKMLNEYLNDNQESLKVTQDTVELGEALAKALEAVWKESSKDSKTEDSEAAGSEEDNSEKDIPEAASMEADESKIDIPEAASMEADESKIDIPEAASTEADESKIDIPEVASTEADESKKDIPKAANTDVDESKIDIPKAASTQEDNSNIDISEAADEPAIEISPISPIAEDSIDNKNIIEVEFDKESIALEKDGESAIPVQTAAPQELEEQESMIREADLLEAQKEVLKAAGDETDPEKLVESKVADAFLDLEQSLESFVKMEMESSKKTGEESAPATREEDVKAETTPEQEKIQKAAAEIRNITAKQDVQPVEIAEEEDLKEWEKPELRSKLTEDEKKLFSYFAPIQGMEQQLAEAVSLAQMKNPNDKTSKNGNIAVMGSHGTGKTALSINLLKAIASQRGLTTVEIEKIDASDLNAKDIVSKLGKMKEMAMVIERAGLLNEKTVDELSKAMEFKTNGLIVVLEDEKKRLRALFEKHKGFSDKFDIRISVPIFTNDELISFGKSYAKELDYKIEEMAILALYNQIGDNQTEEHPVTVADVKDIVDKAIKKAERFGVRKFAKILMNKHYDTDDRIILYEKDFE